MRVEDDRAVVTGNEFVSDDAIDEAIVVGTHYRTTALSQPVDGTVLAGNTATIVGSPNPYRWIWGHTSTTFSDNRSLGRVVGLCEGVQPPVGPFVMTVAFEVLADPENPPMEIRELPLPAVLPPCETSCEAGAVVSEARLAVRKLDTPPGDDVLSFKGQVVLPYPFDPDLDPVAVGVAVVIEDAAGARVLDVTVPGGAYDPLTRAGWQVARSGTRWKYLNKSATAPGGITRLSIREMPKEQPGSLQVKVTGRRGAYPVWTRPNCRSPECSSSPPLPRRPASAAWRRSSGRSRAARRMARASAAGEPGARFRADANGRTRRSIERPRRL